MKQLVKVYKNGTKEWRETVTCDRCGGSGTYVWGASDRPYSGTCYKCGGTGKVAIRTLQYTPEHEAELNAKREKAQAKRAAEWAAQRAEQEAAWQAEQARLEAERAQREAEEAARKAVSQYAGEVGEKIAVRIVESKTAHYEVNYGYTPQTMYVHIMKDASGNVYVWKTQNGGLGWYEGETWYSPDEFTIKGTVKEHSEYNGEKQTVLTRCKVSA